VLISKPVSDIGRLLNACHGLSEIIQIQRGVLVSSDNNIFNEIELALGDNKQMIELRRITFGIVGNYTLRERVIAGLKFYLLLAEEMQNIWQINDIEIIEYSIEQIRNFISKKNI